MEISRHLAGDVLLVAGGRLVARVLLRLEQRAAAGANDVDDHDLAILADGHLRALQRRQHRVGRRRQLLHGLLLVLLFGRAGDDRARRAGRVRRIGRRIIAETKEWTGSETGRLRFCRVRDSPDRWLPR